MRRLLLIPALVLLTAAAARAQSGANVLLVVNEASADSVRIAEHYARVRAVPPGQIVRLTVDAVDEIDRAAYVRQIQAPLAAWLQQQFAQDRILYIVLTKGVPLRIKGTAGRTGTIASVDSELTLLYRRLLNQPVADEGRVENPYFLGGTPIDQAKPFRRDASDLYLVTRLDGYTSGDVIALIDRGAAPARGGRVLLDQKPGPGSDTANSWLADAAARLATMGQGDRVVLEGTARALTGERDVLGYYSWGSNDPAITTRHPGLTFVPGAIAAGYVSTDGRTFTEPPAAWTIGKWLDRSSFFAGSPQSLAGDLIRDGVTGIAAQVAEPFLDASVRPDILFPAYLSGFNLAESFYLATPYLSWQTVVVGDPLCAPFGRAAAPSAVLDPGLEPETGLPAVFASRRQLVLSQTTTPEAARATLKAEARAARGDKPGAQAALEEATALDPKFVAAHLTLADGYEASQEYDKAIERYRLVLAASPDNLMALNNLAYALAVRRGQPAEAIGFAERAMRASGGRSTEAADTLAWVQHLLGRNEEAAKLFDRIVKARPDQAVFRLHAAVVYEAAGRPADAASELREAVRLDPGIEKSPEAIALRARLGR